MVLQPFVGPWPLLQFRKLFYTVGRTPWMSDQLVARPLPTHRTTQTQNKHTHPCLEWDSIPVFERAKTVHLLGRAAAVIGQRGIDKRKEIAGRDVIYGRGNIFSGPIKQRNTFM
jgi:hypothetical protein